MWRYFAIYLHIVWQVSLDAGVSIQEAPETAITQVSGVSICFRDVNARYGLNYLSIIFCEPTVLPWLLTDTLYTPLRIPAVSSVMLPLLCAFPELTFCPDMLNSTASSTFCPPVSIVMVRPFMAILAAFDSERFISLTWIRLLQVMSIQVTARF